MNANETPAEPLFIQPVRSAVPLPPVEPKIRDLDPAKDMPAVAAIHRQSHPGHPGGADFLKYRVLTATPEARRIDVVATVDDEVTGYAFTHFDTEADIPGATIAQVMVAAKHRSRGIGQALAQHLTSHWEAVGSTVVVGHLMIHDSMLFAMRQRFAASSRQYVSRRDLSRPIEVPETPPGFRLRSLTDDTDLRGMYEVSTAVQADIHPDGIQYTPPPFEQWRETTTADPLLDRDATIVAFEGDRPAALSWVSRSEDQAWSVLTGALPAFRGKGLGHLVKAESLRRARDAGVNEMFTSNGDANTPILNINRRLGYELYLEQYTVGRMFNQPSVEKPD